MNYKFLLLFALCLGIVYSRAVNFKVIAFGKKVQVKINGKKYGLTLDKNDEILYVGKISKAPEGDFKYQYVVDGVVENFTRKLKSSTTTTYIEFFGRKDTTKTLKKFSYPNGSWNKSIGKTPLFDESYIPTIHFTGSTANTLMKKPTNKYFTIDKVTFYLKNGKKVATNVKTNPKNWGFAKFQIRMELNKKDAIEGRTLFKLRNGGEDPLNMRQFIYGNINQALGMPTIKSVMVRLYYNKKPMGFYTLQEEAFSDSFVKAEFHGDPKTQTIKNEKIGTPLNGDSGAEYSYSKNIDHYSQFKSNYKNPDKTKLQAFTKALSNLNVKKAKDVKNFEKQWFDIDTFHKAMAMEYLTTDWDGYWYSLANFASYDNPKESTKTTFKHYFISQDHDETFGVGLTSYHNKHGYDHPKQSYKTVLLPKDRVLVNKFIKGSADLQKRFEKTLVSIVENIFNPVAFKEVVDSYYARFQPEMEWDFSFEREYKPSAKVSAGMPDYSYKDFTKNLNQGVGGLKWGLYEWVELRAESLKNEFCITWKGDKKPNKKCVKQY